MKEKPLKKKRKPNIFVRLLALLTTAALMLGALFLVVNRDRWNLDTFRRWLALRSIQTGSTGQGEPFPHSGGESLSLAYLSTGVVTASTAGIHYYSFSGEQYAEQVVDLTYPVLTASASTAAAYGAGDQSVYLYRGGEQIAAISLEGGGDLLSARLNASGWLALTAQESGFKGVVSVYSSNNYQAPVFRLNRSSTFVMDAAVSPDCRSAAVVTMGQTAGRFESQLLVYPLNSEEPSARISLGSVTVLDLDYEDGCIWVLGDSALSVVDTRSWERHTYSFGRNYLKGCALGGDGFALLLLGRYRTGSADLALTLGPDCQPEGSLDLRGQVLDFDAAGRYFCLLAGGQLSVYTPQMELHRRLEDAQGARRVALVSNATAVLADRQHAWLYLPG
ncbi:MAG: hypothetical protein HFF39_07565 [Lawsonibacter sp.]|nr:hypothetical protein [Lawsonibacter sp.]